MIGKFSDFFNIHFDELLRNCQSYFLNDDLAMDVTQEIFLEAWNRYQEFREEEQLLAWCYLASGRIIQNYIGRDMGHGGVWKSLLAAKPEACLAHQAKTMGQENPANLAALRQVLPKMLYPIQQVILMHYYYNFTIGQMSRLLKVRPGSVRAKLRYARKQLLQAGIQGLTTFKEEDERNEDRGQILRLTQSPR